jgi:hypothetical protein
MRLRPALGTLAALASVAGIIGYAASAYSADHQDGPATTADPTADINDVFTWMDGSNVVLAMTTNPTATAGTQFSNSVQYVWHTTSVSAFGAAADAGAPVPLDVIATFDTSQNIHLWVGTTEYVTGIASQTAGLASADGMVKVFAGPRADPFFFNLDGFKQTVADVNAAAPALLDAGAFNAQGCPALNGATQMALQTQLKSAPDGGPAGNHFAALDGMAIVVSVAKSLLTQGGPVVSVWAGTYATGPVGDAGGQ